MDGEIGVARGAGARVGCLGKTWLGPLSGGDGEGNDGGGGIRVWEKPKLWRKA